MNRKNQRKICGAVAMITAFCVMAGGCRSASDDGNTIPTLDDLTTPASTSESEATDTDTQPTETTTETTSLSESETQTEEETTAVTELSQVTETYSNETYATTAGAWTETETSGVMYVTENCYARERAIIGSTPIANYYIGDSVEITAITDTGYYKIASGGFIHSDYLSDEKPETTPPETTTATTAATTEAPVTTEAPTNTDTAATVTSAEETKPFVDPGSGGSAISTGSYNVASSSRYAYNQLTATEKELYNNVVDSVKTFNSIVEIPAGMSKDDVVKVYTIVYNSEPQLFWMGSSISAGSSFATISFKTTDRNEISSMQQEIESAAASVLAQANQYSGNSAKLEVFFNYIVGKNEFSKSEDGYNCSVYNGLTGNGNLQCAGYAKTMQYLCDMAGIECCVVVGTNSEGSSHAWNVVKADDGQWYNIDSTWGDPINDYDSSYIQYEFFLVPDSWIHNITHFNVNTMVRGNGNSVHLFDPPSCKSTAYNYFKTHNKLYSTTDDAEAALYAEFDAQIAAGKNVVEVRVTEKSVYETLTSNDYAKAFQKYAKSKSSSVKQLKVQRSSTTGVQVVHYDIVYN